MPEIDIYNMGLHENQQINDYTSVFRVPGGWLYRNTFWDDESRVTVSTSFVPFNKEFRTKQPRRPIKLTLH